MAQNHLSHHKMKKVIFVLLIFSQSIYAQNSSYLLKTVMNIQDFWIRSFQQNQIIFNPPTVNTYSKLSPISSAQCGLMQEPNFMYCYLNNNIYLSEDLFSEMSQEFNLPSVEFAIAHEYGHAVQNQLNKIQSTSVTREYQADCLSGVYMSRYNNKDVIDKSIGSFLFQYTDHSSNFSTLFDPQSHGNAQGRFDAFHKGFQTRDVKQCFDAYDLDNVVNGFTNLLGDLISGNNLYNEQDFIGTWKASNTEIKFTQNNTVTINLYNGKILNGTYKVDIDKIYLRFKNDNVTIEKVHKIISTSNDKIVYVATKDNLINSFGTLIQSKDINLQITLTRIKN